MQGTVRAVLVLRRQTIPLLPPLIWATSTGRTVLLLPIMALHVEISLNSDMLEVFRSRVGALLSPARTFTWRVAAVTRRTFILRVTPVVTAPIDRVNVTPSDTALRAVFLPVPRGT